ncbi:iron-containing redox enzyme family protein [Caballeronia sordidicola]|uniref:iron-containing redox enzyme family protein n=1 Tax=Caballeronia sordidicola TaxID=196367 RepID=UPI00094D0005|nr:iron-containing redox enzyme family protein [Caballeronia sordidicola]
MLTYASLSLSNPDTFHRLLASFNSSRLAIATPSSQWHNHLETEYRYRAAEGHFLEGLRATVTTMIPDSFRNTDGFVSWFESLVVIGPGQQHPLFDWLAGTASLAQMRWFLRQEAAGEAGFDDLLAYTQVKLPTQAKLECARNYWDEMGHGKQKAMHGEMLERMVRELDLQPFVESTVWESLALSNTMLGLATTRRYTYQALGALGAIELTAPQRVAKVSNGMRRLGFNAQQRAYFDLHASLDVAHAKAWIREIIRPLVDADHACAKFIAEGALMRLICGQRCFERYSLELGVEQPYAERAVLL